MLSLQLPQIGHGQFRSSTSEQLNFVLLYSCFEFRASCFDMFFIRSSKPNMQADDIIFCAFNTKYLKYVGVASSCLRELTFDKYSQFLFLANS